MQGTELSGASEPACNSLVTGDVATEPPRINSGGRLGGTSGGIPGGSEKLKCWKDAALTFGAVGDPEAIALLAEDNYREVRWRGLRYATL